MPYGRQAGRQGCISGGGGLAGKATQEMDSEHQEKDNDHQGSSSRESSMRSGVVCYPREILVSREDGKTGQSSLGSFSLIRPASIHLAFTWGTIGHALSRGHLHAPSSADHHSRRNISPCPVGLGMAETHGW